MSLLKELIVQDPDYQGMWEVMVWRTEEEDGQRKPNRLVCRNLHRKLEKTIWIGMSVPNLRPQGPSCVIVEFGQIKRYIRMGATGVTISDPVIGR